MKIYRISANINDFSWLGKCNEKDFDSLFKMRGESFKNNWKPILIEKIDEDDNALLPIGDFPNFDEPVISNKAAKILFENKCEYIELLDVKIKGNDTGDNHYLLNVVNILDCIDFVKSRIDRFKCDGGIREIKEYVFKEETLKHSFIFRIKGYEKKYYVNQDFKDIVEKNELQGFVFTDTADKYENPFLKLLKK